MAHGQWNDTPEIRGEDTEGAFRPEAAKQELPGGRSRRAAARAGSPSGPAPGFFFE